MWYEWFFDGLGSQIIGIFIGLIFGGGIGGFAGFKIGAKQKQKARDHANQTQIGVINTGADKGKKDGR